MIVHKNFLTFVDGDWHYDELHDYVVISPIELLTELGGDASMIDTLAANAANFVGRIPEFVLSSVVVASEAIKNPRFEIVRGMILCESACGHPCFVLGSIRCADNDRG